MSKIDLHEYLRSERRGDKISAEQRAQRVETLRQQAAALQKEVESAVLEIAQSGVVLTEEKIRKALQYNFAGDPEYSGRIAFETVAAVQSIDPLRLQSYGIEIIHHWDDEGLRFTVRVGPIPFLNR